MTWKVKILMHLPKILLVVGIIITVASVAYAEITIPYQPYTTGSGGRYTLR